MDVLKLLDELQVLARNGLCYADNEYDKARYERILELTAEAYASSLELPAAEARSRLASELGHATPKVGSDVAVFDAEGRVLLVRRSDNLLWCLPCGWIEPFEAPEEAAVREVREETGLEVRIVEQVAAVHRFPSERNGPHAMVSMLFLGEVTGGEIRTSPETVEVAYRRLDEVTDWHANHRELASLARGAVSSVTVDPAEPQTPLCPESLKIGVRSNGV